MCPLCITTATVTWLVAGAASTGGLALAVSRLRRHMRAKGRKT